MAPVVSADGNSVTLSSAEFDRLTTKARGASSAASSSRKKSSVSSGRIRMIPKPAGEAGHGTSSGRTGYNVETESLLSHQNFKSLKLTVELYVFRYMDVTKLFKDSTLDHRTSVVQKCREVHPCLRFYEADWLVQVLMTQILNRTSKAYTYDDWGDEELLEAMEAKDQANVTSEEEIEDPPTPVKRRSKKQKTSTLKTPRKQVNPPMTRSDTEDDPGADSQPGESDAPQSDDDSQSGGEEDNGGDVVEQERSPKTVQLTSKSTRSAINVDLAFSSATTSATGKASTGKRGTRPKANAMAVKTTAKGMADSGSKGKVAPKKKGVKRKRKSDSEAEDIVKPKAVTNGRKR